MATDDYYNVEIEGVLNQTLFSKKELIEKFGWEEYFIFSLMLLVSILIGLFFWWKGQNSNAEYMMGGGNMGTLPMTMSLIARSESSFEKKIF